MKRHAIWVIVALIAMIPPDLRAQEAWNIDSVGFARDWPDTLVGKFLNTQEVVPLPWGDKAYAVQGITEQDLLGVWIKDTEGERYHSYLPLPTGTSRSVDALILAKDENDSALLLAGTDAGPYGSYDGRTWFPRNGFTVQQLDDGEHSWWFTINDLLDEGNGQWWASSGFFGEAFSPDYGRSWQLINAGLNHRGEGVFNTGNIYLAADNKVWLQGEDALYHLERHNERDANSWEWIPFRDGVEYNLADGRQVCFPILATWSNGRCSDENGTMYLWSGWGLIWRSTDSGENFEQMTERDNEWSPADGNCVTVPTMIVSESGLIFFGEDNGGLLVSADQGENWQGVGGSSEIRQDRNAHFWWWHGTDDVNYGLRVGGILDLSFDLDGHLLIGTWDGTLRSSIPMNGVIEQPNSVSELVFPETIELLSVYPNPFNGVLRVNINAESNQPYSVSIFDNTGRLVTVLSKGIGSSQLVWDASDNPSGLYWVQSVVENKHLTKGVYLVR